MVKKKAVHRMTSPYTFGKEERKGRRKDEERKKKRVIITKNLD